MVKTLRQPEGAFSFGTFGILEQLEPLPRIQDMVSVQVIQIQHKLAHHHAHGNLGAGGKSYLKFLLTSGCIRWSRRQGLSLLPEAGVQKRC